MKKIEILSPLNHEYNQALIFCSNIRRGFSLSVEPERMKLYSNWYFHRNLKFHFEIEEDFIFSLLNDRQEIIAKSRAYQRKLKKYFLNQNEIEKSLSLTEELLESYIRFEKKKLISLITKKIDTKRLNLIMDIYTNCIIYEDWGDRFWENKQLN